LYNCKKICNGIETTLDIVILKMHKDSKRRILKHGQNASQGVSGMTPWDENGLKIHTKIKKS